MKKSGFKNRGKPLSRGTSRLKTRKQLRSNPDKHDWVAMARKIYPRSGGICERCGMVQILREDLTKSNIHHIRKRADGGDDSPENLLMVCAPMQFFGGVDRSCHTYIHANPVESRKAGWLK